MQRSIRIFLCSIMSALFFAVLIGALFNSTRSFAAAVCLPRNAINGSEIIAVGINEGPDETVRDPLRRLSDLHPVKITGRSTGKPVLLVLTAYDAILWKIDKKIQHRVKGIIARGVKAQRVVGYAFNTPTTVYFRESGKSPPPCGGTVATPRRGGKGLEELNEHVKLILGRPIEKFIGNYKARAIDIDSNVMPASFPKGNMNIVTPANPKMIPLGELPEGIAGMELLLKRGHVRRATIEDFRIWTRQATESLETGTLAPVELPQIAPSRSFVAQTKINIPRKLFGANSILLIIPFGVPEPEYTKSHNEYLYEEDGKCAGNCFSLK